MLEWLKHLSNIISVTENVLSLFPSRKSGKLFLLFLKTNFFEFPWTRMFISFFVVFS